MIRTLKPHTTLSGMLIALGLATVAILVLSGLKADNKAHEDGKVCSHSAVVKSESTEVLYHGIDNVITIEIPGQEADKINASVTPTDAGELVKIEAGKYRLHLVNANDRSVNVHVSQKMGDGTMKVAASTEFKVLNLPAPVASIGGNSGPTITVEELRKAKAVHADLLDFPIDKIHFEVIEYGYIYKPARGSLLRGLHEGDTYPDELKEAFKYASRGDLLIISSITAKHKDYSREVHGALVYTVR